MARVVLSVLCWLVLLINVSESADAECTFSQELAVGTSYYIYNPRYPYKYRGGNSCSWTMKSDYRIKMNCTTFELPRSNNCNQDKLSVQVNSTSSYQFCGNRAFNISSDGPTMVVTFKSPLWSTGGRFLCEVEAVKRPEDLISENCRCGWKNPTRIVGGVNAGVNEFPMMAGLVDSVNRIVFCGCTIISNRYVVTAAHCVDTRDYRELGILVGDHDLSTGADTNATVLHRVIRSIVHPNYSVGNNLNDIAILKTEREIVFNNQVGPACLPFQHSPDTFGGNYVDVLGWGSTSFGGSTSDILQKVTLSVLTNLQCSQIYSNITRDLICTYGEDKDSCQFDSGGPVLWQNPTSRRLILTGIISQGTNCGISAGINTRVGAYIDWIVSQTSDSSYCIIE
ncbi:venom serine protease 34-like isoform X1 [Osmia bicornis bicornis]|uniref:venom serine protease 34-like isoform X1 n=1 Tax=Osmia bicornis bicornis TaxID=1437191 RepID=UPI001EAEADC9|nr:venom serine protease 34-like isoform X1 [Osmia bicornis bicornis]